uniref:Uncharacterized protein n=1 Tax=Strongyloides venezuelensis TaxID=75913 RepID=A0A0K0FRB9_STRVS
MKVLEGILFVDDFSSGQVLGPFRHYPTVFNPKKDSNCEENLKIKILEEAEKIKKGNALRTVFKEGYFDISNFKQKNDISKKRSLKLYAYQVHVLAKCLYNYLDKEHPDLKNENSVDIKIQEFKCLLLACLNLVSLTQDYTIDFNTAFHLVRKNVNFLYRCVFRVFTKKY